MQSNNLHKEQELLNRVAGGDAVAFRELVSLYASLLGTHILRFTKSKEQTEEIVQDIFLQVWISRETLAHIRNFRNYLFVISRNHALNAVRVMVRDEQRLKKWQQDNQDEWTTAAAQEEGKAPPPMSLIEEAINQLPPQQQKAWLLSRKQGLKHREIAVEMGISQETVKKYIQYANASLLQYLEPRIGLMLAGALFLA